MTNMNDWFSGKKYVPTEADEQIVFASWLDINQILYFHPPNGGFRNEREGAKFKRMGVKAGVPDIVIPIARQNYHGAFIELKRIGGKVSLHQKFWLVRLEEEGYFTAVAYGALQAIEVARNYLQDPLRCNI